MVLVAYGIFFVLGFVWGMAFGKEMAKALMLRKLHAWGLKTTSKHAMIPGTKGDVYVSKEKLKASGFPDV